MSKTNVVDAPIGGADKPLPISFLQTGHVQEIDFKEGMSITAALKAAGVTVAKSQELRLNNRVITDRDTTLQPGDQIAVVGQVRGGK